MILEVAVLYGFDLSQVFTPIILRLYRRILCVRRAQQRRPPRPRFMYFYSRPLREGRPARPANTGRWSNFYSRPYARGDTRSHPGEVLLLIFLLAPLREGRPEMSIMLPPKAPFLLAPLHEGRQQFFTKPQVDLYDKLLKIHIFQINTFCILQHSFENFNDYFVGSARTSRKNVYGKGWR